MANMITLVVLFTSAGAMLSQRPKLYRDSGWAAPRNSSPVNRQNDIVRTAFGAFCRRVVIRSSLLHQKCRRTATTTKFSLRRSKEDGHASRPSFPDRTKQRRRSGAPGGNVGTTSARLYLWRSSAP